MTYGYEIEPLAETATKLGVSLKRPLIDLVHEYSDALPITAAHVVETGQRTCRFYWVSGSSLVVLETQEPEHEEVGFVIQASGNVRAIKSAALDIEIAAVKHQPSTPSDTHTLAGTIYATDSVLPPLRPKIFAM